MSLVNDVLRQIDKKPKIRPELLSSAPVVTSETDQYQKLPTLIFTGFCAILVILIAVQIFSGTSILNLLNSEPKIITHLSHENLEELNVKRINEKEQMQVVENVVHSAPLPALPSNPVVESGRRDEMKVVGHSSETSEEDQVKPKENGYATVEVEREISKSKPDFLDIKNDSRPKRIAEKNKESVSVIKVKQDPADQYYRKSLMSLNSGNYLESKLLISDAISIRPDTDYVILKARIFIEENNASGFYDHVTSYSDLRDIEWLKLVAPGLQIFSFSKLSNQYYGYLISREPNVIRWKLALALNYLRLLETDKAIKVYQSLTVSEGISRQQLNWLKKRIHQLQRVEG